MEYLFEKIDIITLPNRNFDLIELIFYLHNQCNGKLIYVLLKLEKLLLLLNNL